ncbi:MAG: FtsQ-type POTRA domain-containing protein [Thermoanaerobaculia bacterium]|nr:FtsQ-type POTRA domain-containing protein [Thermoanaerobaculia bacterium]
MSESRFLARLERAKERSAGRDGSELREAPEFAEREAPPWDLPRHPTHEPLAEEPQRDVGPDDNRVLQEIRARRRPRQESAAPRRREATSPSRTARDAARAADVLPFRRSRTARRVRRLRRHPLVRWLQPLVIALLLVGIPAAIAGWTLRSPAFAVDEIRLSSDSPARRVSEQWVLDRLAGLEGENLWLLNLEWPVAEMSKHPWVHDVGIRKQPPSTLVVRVLEKREAALYADPAGLVYVDLDGCPVAPIGPHEEASDLTVLRGKVAEPAPGKPAPELRAAVALLQEIQQAGAPWAAGLDEVEILSTRDFRVHTKDLPFPLLVRAGTVESRSRRLVQLLPWISELGRLRVVDLRFARRIIVEPAEPEAQSAPSGEPEAT